MATVDFDETWDRLGAVAHLLHAGRARGGEPC
jgi:hypothetical protein